MQQKLPRRRDYGPQNNRGSALASLLQLAAIAIIAWALLSVFFGDEDTPAATDADAATDTPIATATDLPAAQGHVEAGQAFMAANQFEQASREFSRATEADPTNIEGWLGGAMADIYLQAPRSAIDKADTAIVLDSENAQPWAVRALALTWLDEFEDAESYANQALDRDNNNVLAWAVLAHVNVDLGDLEAATAALRRAEQLNASHPDVLRARAYITENTPVPGFGFPDYLAAIEVYEQLNATGLELSWNYYHLGLNYLGYGDFTSATAAFTRAQALDPDSALPLIGLSRIYIRTQEYDLAREALDAAQALDPDDRNVYGFRGVLEYRLDNYDEAFFYLNCAVEGCTDEARGIDIEPVTLSQGNLLYFTDYGLILTERGECTRGLGFLSVAVEYAPSDPNVVQVYNLGIGYCGGLESDDTTVDDGETPADDGGG